MTDERDLKRVEEALRISEERLRLALEGASDGIWDWNFQTGETYFSPRYYTMLGYEPGEFPMSFESWRRLLHPDGAQAAEQSVRHSVENHMPFSVEFRLRAKNGEWRWILSRGKVVESDKDGNPVRVAGSHTDITDRKRAEEALEKRIVALTKPLDAADGITFEDLFDVYEIQRLQDLYAEAFGVAALITRPDGTPITGPSNFCELCGEIIRNTPKGVKNCNRSDAMIGRHNPLGPNIQPCLSVGLCNAGVGITVGGHHVANWLIGQVRNENQKEGEIIAYAREIGADEEAFRAAYHKVPVMSQEQFERLAHVLFELSNQLSTTAYQNVQQARFIAERKQAEEALRQANLVVENSPVMLFRWRAEEGWPVVLVSQNVVQLGYTPEELLDGSVPFSDMVHPDDLERIGREVHTHSTSGAERFQQEYRIITKNGQVRWVDDRTAVERDARGRVTHFQGIVVDITERKQADKALRDSAELYRIITNTTMDGFAISDQNGRLLDVNDAYCEMLGYSREELLEMHIWDIEAKETLEEIEERLIKIRGAGSDRFETRHRRKDGRVIDVEINLTFTQSEGRQLTFVRDITERKQAEEALRNYERIVSVSRDLMALVNCDFKYEEVNESYANYHGRLRDEIIGRPVWEIMGESTFEKRLRPRLELVFSGQEMEFQDYFDFPGRGRRYVHIWYVPLIDERGKVEGAVVNCRDITEIKKLEEQLTHSQKIESLGTLAGGVAHEINNPINGIMNYAQLIMDRLEKENPMRAFAEEIIHETQRVATIVRNLLTFARNEKQTHSPAYLPSIVSSVLSLVQTVMRHDQIDLVVEIPEDLPKFKCRSQQIQQVLMNLMTNARDALNERYPDYSPEKRLRLSARLIDKNGIRSIRTTVEDSGAGIEPDILDRIFDPFFTTKPKETGTGLGLSISYGIVRDHGGELWVESKPGQYTRFHMDLPVDNGWTL